MTRFLLAPVLVAIPFLSTSVAEGEEAGTSVSKPAPVKPIELGEIQNLHQCGNLLMASQPTPADFLLLKQRGVQCIVNYRTDGEVTWDEKSAAESHGIEYISIPYGTIDSLTDEVFEKSRELLRKHKGKPLFLHCGAATRVAAVWLAYRVLDENVPLDTAVSEAEGVGLRSKALRARSLEYIKSQQK